MALLGALALVAVLHAATGGEPLAAMVWALALSGAAIAVSGHLVGDRRATKRPVWPVLGAAAVCLAAILSAAATYWPLRLAYGVSRGALERLAERVRAGERLALPVRAGIFRVRGAEISRHGVVCLWTHPDPAGSTGFVQCRRDDIPFNLGSLVRLDDRWQFISED